MKGVMLSASHNIRLIPIVMAAVASLFVLKSFGLMLDGGYTLGDRLANRNKDTLRIIDLEAPAETPAKVASAAPPRRASWASEMFNFPDITGSTGSAEASKPPASEQIPLKVTDKPPAEANTANPPPGGTAIPFDNNKPTPAGERAILERLHERRQELDSRNREMEMRESLIKAAEKRLESRVTELKDIEGRIKTSAQNKEEAEAGRLKNLVTMYENMKAKDAARIFDRLDMKILLEVSNLINPRRMSDILAQMQPEAAERLTVELANKASNGSNPTALPKIEGKPGAN